MENEKESRAFQNALGRVEHPSRYESPEMNIRRKGTASHVASFAFAFPDTYEIGMSHLGGKVLYELINGKDGLVMERAFCPWPDMEEQMRTASVRLGTVESRTALHRFDIVGFSIQHELTLTNMLTMLDLGGIPLLSRDRSRDDPLVMAGGPGVANPEPFADFVDVVFIGEAEQVLPGILYEIGRLRRRGVCREELLGKAAQHPGVYIPSLHRVLPDPKTGFLVPQPAQGLAWPIRRQVAMDFEHAPIPVRPVVPSCKVVHDRYAVEISRGCLKGCRFCQAGMIYRPTRERAPERILEAIERALAATGYDEVSFSSLSAGDYSRLEELVVAASRMLAERNVSLSIASIKPSALTPALAGAIKRVRKTGFTIAVEAATQRLRDVINKPVTDEEVLQGVLTAFEHGWSSVKAYFMINLPTETLEDVMEIPNLAWKILRQARKMKGRGKNLTVSVSSFVPKPHTPFERHPMASMDALRQKQTAIGREMGKLGSRFKWHNPSSSWMEAIFARGDRALGQVLLEAWKRGARFDGWSDRLDTETWLEAFRAARVPHEPYLYPSGEGEGTLPWHHIATGVSPGFLKRESSRAAKAQVSQACRFANCPGCGVCPEDFIEQESRRRGAKPPTSGVESSPGQTHPAVAGCEEFRFRIRFQKIGKARYLSHLELALSITRAARRAGLPLAYSKGFHPMPRISFGPALPVGMEGMAEYLDVILSADADPARVLLDLRGQAPEGIAFEEIRKIPARTRALSAIINLAAYRAHPIAADAGFAQIGSAIDRLLQSECVTIERTARNGSRRVLDVRKQIVRLEIEPSGGAIRMDLALDNAGSVRPDEILRLLLGRDDAYDIVKEGAYCVDGLTRRTPMDAFG